MSICVYESGNTTIRNGGIALDNCTTFVHLSYDDYQTLMANNISMFDLTIAQANELGSAVFFLWGITYLFKQLEKSV